MTIPFWCLIVVTFIPLILGGLGVRARAKAFGSADNKFPRAQAAQLDAKSGAVYAAQENAWEAAIIFAVAILTTHLAGLDPAAAAPFAIAFVVFRVIHAVAYIMDIDKLRSACFLAQMVCVVTLVVKAA